MTTNSTNRIAKNNQKPLGIVILTFMTSGTERFHFSGTNMSVRLARNVSALKALSSTVEFELDGTASKVDRDAHDLSLCFYRVYIYNALPFCCVDDYRLIRCQT
jgi:hypothetical protein